jgi:hypothetical protein
LLGETTPQQVLNGGSTAVCEDELKKIGGAISAKNFPKGIAGHLQTDIHQYDCYGRYQSDLEVAKSNKLFMVRLQLKNINGADSKNIGSVLYAQSFIWIESKTNVCVTKNIPNT